MRSGRLDLRRNFFLIRVIESWNEIPPDLKAVESAARFRAGYKKLRVQT